MGHLDRALSSAAVICALLTLPANAKNPETQVPEVGITMMPTGSDAQGQDDGTITTLVPADKDKVKAIKGATFKNQVKGTSGSTNGSSSGSGFSPSATQTATTQASTTTATAGCATNVSTGGAPSDSHGSVGASYVAVVTNFSIGFYSRQDCSKSGSSTTLRSFVAAQGRFDTSNQQLFDSRTFYDKTLDRFFVTTASQCLSNQNVQCPDPSQRQDQYQYVAVSQTNNPTGAWWVYRTTLSANGGTFCKKAVNSFWDFPVGGRSKARFFVVGNDFLAGAATGAILSYDLAPMVAGKAPTVTCLRGPTAGNATLSANTVPPINRDGTTTPDAFLSTGTSTSASSVSEYLLTEGASSSTDALSGPQTIAVPTWTVPPSALQPNHQALETMDGRFTSATLQSGSSLWNLHTISTPPANVPVYARWRLYQFSTSASATSLLGYVDAPGDGNLFNASMDVDTPTATTGFVTSSRTNPNVQDGTGNVAIVTSQGALPTQPSSTQPQAPFTATWPTPTVVAVSSTQFSTTVTSPQTSCNNNPDGSQACRWGDYSATQLDPKAATASPIGFSALVTGSAANQWATRSTAR